MLTKVAAGLMLGVTQIAMAQNAGKVAQNVAGSFNALGLAVQAFFGLAGLVLIGLSIFTLIKYNKTEGQGAKLSTFAIYLVGGGMLFYIASLIQTTGDTIWGDGQGNRTKVQIQSN
jgi:predicted transporter